jgi:hypothetical protein
MKKRKNADPAHDVLGYERLPLDAIFRPEAVAVIGATDRPGNVGRTVMWNLISNISFSGLARARENSDKICHLAHAPAYRCCDNSHIAVALIASLR